MTRLFRDEEFVVSDSQTSDSLKSIPLPVTMNARLSGEYFYFFLQESKNSSEKSLNLVAAYDTDSNSDGENDAEKVIKPVSGDDNPKVLEEPIVEGLKENNTNVPNINTSSFASIITGGKSDGIDMDEELNKFKEELEKDLQMAAAVESTQESPNEAKEQSFDEKTFQRKRRIEFSANMPGKIAPDESREKSGVDTEMESNAGSAISKVKSKFISFQKSHVEFESRASPEMVVYGPKPQSPLQTEATESVSVNDRTEKKAEIDDLCDVISGKVKFLSVGKPEVSAVQIMSIQLEVSLMPK